MKKLIFLDIDGTLIDNYHGLCDINEITRKGIAQAQIHNDVFIASGRTHCFIAKNILAYPFDGFVMCNGAYVEYHDQCIFKRMIPLEAKQVLIEACKKYNWDFFIESRDAIYVKDLEDPSTKYFMNIWHMDPLTTFDHFKVEEIECYIAMINIHSEQEVKLMTDILEPYFDIARHPNKLSFDLNIKGVHKGTGIEALCKNMGIPIEDTIAFGDGNNDIEMIETAGVGVAMGNALDNLKKAADVITDGVLENGVVNQLKRMKIIE